jgi:hypothetical protein
MARKWLAKMTKNGRFLAKMAKMTQKTWFYRISVSGAI